MVYGYSRCSTNETKQDINRQVRELKAAGAEEIFMEYDGDAKIKSQQQAMFAQAHAGDTITVLEVSRLARSTQQLCEIIDLVREKHLRLVIVGSIILDCRSGLPDPMSEAFLQMAGVFSQLELSMIRMRVRSGMANARAKGKRIHWPFFRCKLGEIFRSGSPIFPLFPFGCTCFLFDARFFRFPFIFNTASRKTTQYSMRASSRKPTRA